MRVQLGIGFREQLYYIAASFVALCISLFIFDGRLSAQSLNLQNPADRQLPWSSEFNPAVVSFHDAKISVGLKMLHLGFVPDNSFGLREHHLNVSLPFYLPQQIAVGFDLRYFSAGLYSELGSALLLSREFFYRFSLGAKIGVERRSFNQDDFNLVDPADPVLAGGLAKSSLNLGLGLYWNPGKLSLGIGIDHVNRANIAFENRSNLPREISGAIGYEVGLLQPALVFHDDGMHKRVGFAITASPFESGDFRLGFEKEMPIKLEASFDLSKNNNLRYGIDLPTEGTRSVSVGSHELIYSHVFAREPEIASPDLLFSTSKLEILEETIIRSMPSDLDPGALATSEELSPAYLAPRGYQQKILIITAGSLSAHETKLDKARRFLKLAEVVSEMVEKYPDLQLFLRTDENSRDDAHLLKLYLERENVIAANRVEIAKVNATGLPDLSGFKTGHVTLTRNQPVLSTEELVIQLQIPGKTRRTRNWLLKIKDERGHLVRAYSGKGSLPGSIVWDWRDGSGELVQPGKYAFDIFVRGKSGKVQKSETEYVDVTHIRRSVNLKFKTERGTQTSQTSLLRNTADGSH